MRSRDPPASASEVLRWIVLGPALIGAATLMHRFGARVFEEIAHGVGIDPRSAASRSAFAVLATFLVFLVITGLAVRIAPRAKELVASIFAGLVIVLVLLNFVVFDFFRSLDGLALGASALSAVALAAFLWGDVRVRARLRLRRRRGGPRSP